MHVTIYFRRLTVGTSRHRKRLVFFYSPISDMVQRRVILFVLTIHKKCKITKIVQGLFILIYSDNNNDNNNNNNNNNDNENENEKNNENYRNVNSLSEISEIIHRNKGAIGRIYTSLRTADAFPVVASEGEKRRPEMRLLFAG